MLSTSQRCTSWPGFNSVLTAPPPLTSRRGSPLVGALPQPAPAQVREAAVARPLAAARVAVLAVTGAAEGLSSVVARILVEPSVLRICRADRPRLDAVARDRRPVCASRAVAVAAAGLRATRVELRL